MYKAVCVVWRGTVLFYLGMVSLVLALQKYSEKKYTVVRVLWCGKVCMIWYNMLGWRRKHYELISCQCTKVNINISLC